MSYVALADGNRLSFSNGPIGRGRPYGVRHIPTDKMLARSVAGITADQAARACEIAAGLLPGTTSGWVDNDGLSIASVFRDWRHPRPRPWSWKLTNAAGETLASDFEPTRGLAFRAIEEARARLLH